MHLQLLILFALATASTPTVLPERKFNIPPESSLNNLPERSLNGLPYVPSPGPIPYPNPLHGFPNEQSVTSNDKHDGLSNVNIQNLTDCLNDFGSGQFYDTWDGNNCGGMGWFKGASNGKINTYDCYQICATWLLGMGIQRGSTDYQCDFRTGTKGHCWMGYQQQDPNDGAVATS
ncbi:hypothetical protein MMC28_004217 [Mycoblastus sanguinarius]|nr:hypothetical protein [Mycoblastus sanguinarius]